MRMVTKFDVLIEIKKRLSELQSKKIYRTLHMLDAHLHTYVFGFWSNIACHPNVFIIYVWMWIGLALKIL